MKTRTVLAGLSAIALLGLPAAPAQAAVPRIAITCGMVVTQDAHLYLRKDLHCPDFGVRVQWGNPDLPDPIPDVTVNLRGHTLRGSGVSSGITAFAGQLGLAYLQVRNGRVENFETGAGGDHDTRFTNVRFVDNDTGFYCNKFCSVEQSRFTGSSVGLDVGTEGHAVVKHSVFSNNQTGAGNFGYLSGLTIERSRFFDNEVGLHHTAASSSMVSYSVFARNGTGVLVEDSAGGCVWLHKDRFVRNDRDVVGPIC